MFYCSANKDTYYILYIFIRNKCSWQRKEKNSKNTQKCRKITTVYDNDYKQH